MFQGWDNVFMLLGTASGSLIGLLFVVVTLTSGQDRARTLRAGGIYLTPEYRPLPRWCWRSGAAAIAPRLPAMVTAIVMAAAALFGFINAVRTCLGILEFRKSGDPPHWSDLWMYGGTPWCALPGPHCSGRFDLDRLAARGGRARRDPADADAGRHPQRLGPDFVDSRQPRRAAGIDAVVGAFTAAQAP